MGIDSARLEREARRQGAVEGTPLERAFMARTWPAVREKLPRDLPHTEPEAQYEWADAAGRKFRADFAWPEHRLLVELEGGIFDFERGDDHGKRRGAHGSVSNVLADIEKQNLAVLLGWRMVRITPPMIEDDIAVELVLEALTGTPGAYGRARKVHCCPEGGESKCGRFNASTDPTRLHWRRRMTSAINCRPCRSAHERETKVGRNVRAA